MNVPVRDPEDAAGFVSVEERWVPRAVERLKETLPEEPWPCPSCGYAGEAFRWGIRTYPAREPRRVALVLCCPSCERPTDLSAVGDDAAGGV